MDNNWGRHGNEMRFDIPKNFSVEEVGKFREEAHKMLDSGKKHFIMDFHNCEFIDSTGLGVLIGIYRKCMEREGSMKMQGIRGNVRRVFQLTRLDKVFDIAD